MTEQEPPIEAQEKLRDHVEEVFADLTEKESEVLRARFGLDGRERTLKEIGEEIGMRERGKPLSKQRIAQIEAGALQKLRKPENRLHLRDYLE